MSSDDSGGFLKRVSDNVNYILIITGGISFLFGIISSLIQLVRGVPRHYTLWLLIGGATGLWLLSIYCWRIWKPEKGDKSPSTKDQEQQEADPDKPVKEQAKKVKWRNQVKWLAGSGIWAIPVVFVVGYGTWQHFQSLPSKHTIVLLAEFQNNATGKDDDLVTETLFGNLEEPLSNDPNTKLIRIDTSFKTGDDADARSAGKDHKAALVIWGGYIKIPDDPTNQVRMKLEILQPLQVIDGNEETAELADGAQRNNQEVSCDQLKQLQIALRTHISQEMSYFTLFTLGMAKYAKEDWDGAIGYFADALNQIQLEEGKEEIDEQSKVLRQATVYNLLGRSYYAKNMLGEAIANYNKAIELNPAYYQAYTNLGNVYYDQERYYLALTNYNKAIELNDKYARAYKGRGDVYNYGQRDYEKAFENYDKAIDLDNQIVCAYNNRGTAYSRQGNALASDRYYDRTLDQYYDQALDNYKHTLELDPKHTLTYTNRGGLYLSQGKISLAIADYTTAIELNPEEVYPILPWVPLRQRDARKAIAEFTTAIELDPKNIAIYLLWADFYAVHGDDEKAIENYDKAIALDPGNADRYISLADFYADQTNPEKVIENYDKAIALEPKIADHYINRGAAYSSQSKYEQAIADHNKAIELDPKIADYYFQRALLYGGQENNEQAIADYNKAIELNPENSDYYIFRADFYARQGNYEKAIADYTKVIELDPLDGYFQQAAFYERQGNYEKAIADYAQLITLYPDYASAYYFIARAYSLNSNVRAALENLQRAISLEKEPWRESAKTEPGFDAIRQDAQFRELVGK